MKSPEYMLLIENIMQDIHYYLQIKVLKEGPAKTEACLHN